MPASPIVTNRGYGSRFGQRQVVSIKPQVNERIRARFTNRFSLVFVNFINIFFQAQVHAQLQKQFKRQFERLAQAIFNSNQCPKAHIQFKLNLNST